MALGFLNFYFILVLFLKHFFSFIARVSVVL